MSQNDIDLHGLKDLQKKIIQCHNQQKGRGVEPLLKAFRNHPANYSDAQLARNLTYIAKRVKHLPSRLQLFEQTVELDGQNPSILTSYANDLVKNNKIDQALAIFEGLIKDAPGDYKALTAYGNRHYRE